MLRAIAHCGYTCTVLEILLSTRNLVDIDLFSENEPRCTTTLSRHTALATLAVSATALAHGPAAHPRGRRANQRERVPLRQWVCHCMSRTHSGPYSDEACKAKCYGSCIRMWAGAVGACRPRPVSDLCSPLSQVP